MIRIRQWHSYIGLFIAPSVLFFALTGSIQLFSLHEAHGHYEPPALLEKLASVHKDQVFAPGDHHAAPEDAAPPPAANPDDADKPQATTLILKGFFLLVALGLAISTGFGLWMGLTLTRRKGVAWSLVVAGTLIPALLLIV